MAFVLSLRPDVTVSDRGPGELQLQVPGRPATVLSFKQVTPAIRDVFTRLSGGAAGGGIDEDLISEDVMLKDGPQGLFKLTHFMKKLEDARLICRSVGDKMNLQPLSDRFTLCESPQAPAKLSRFALVRRIGDRLVMESPLGHARVEFGTFDARMISLLVEPTTATELAREFGCSEDEASGFLQLLASAGCLTTGDEDSNPALMQWEFQDLFFHSRSRIGRHANPFGGTFAFEGKLPPLPGMKPPMGEIIPLAKPDIDALMKRDAPFAKVVEERRSVRDQGDTPISIDQLSEFLFRSARIKAVMQTEHGEVSMRLYPAGGALYETEIYLVVDRVAGLDSGLYHYDPLNHGLERVTNRTPQVQALLDQAYYTADQRSRPQVLIVLAARFQRMQWKYQSMVYAAILKHVGVLYQQMYLAATAMGLAPCALGGGHSDLFAEAAGLNYYEETSVGEFILGTRADDSRTASRFDEALSERSESKGDPK